MTKLKLTEIFNRGEENYFKIKIENENSEEYIKGLIEFLEKLGVSDHLDAEPEILSAKYKKWIGRHQFFRTKNYAIFIIFGEKNLHLVVRCSLENRKNLLKFLKG